LISTRIDTQDNSELTELQPPQPTKINEEPIISSKSQVSHQDSPPDNSMIPDDSPLISPPPNEEVVLDKPRTPVKKSEYLAPQAQPAHPLTNMTTIQTLTRNRQSLNFQTIHPIHLTYNMNDHP